MFGWVWIMPGGIWIMAGCFWCADAVADVDDAVDSDALMLLMH